VSSYEHIPNGGVVYNSIQYGLSVLVKLQLAGIHCKVLNLIPGRYNMYCQMLFTSVYARSESVT
jgi:hypothetical protein